MGAMTTAWLAVLTTKRATSPSWASKRKGRWSRAAPNAGAAVNATTRPVVMTRIRTRLDLVVARSLFAPVP